MSAETIENADLTPAQALGVALSVAAPRVTMAEAQEKAPAALADLEAMGYALTPLVPEVPPREDGLREAVEAQITGLLSISEPLSPIERGNLGAYQDVLNLIARLAATRTPEPPDSGDGAAPEPFDVRQDAANGLRRFAEDIDKVFAEAGIEGRHMAGALLDVRWVPEAAVRASLALLDYLPCPMRSSLTDQPCVLPWGHPQDATDPPRFHKFAAIRSGSQSPAIRRRGGSRSVGSDAVLREAAHRLVDAYADHAAVMGLARDGFPQGWKAEMDADDALLCALQDTRTALDGRERPHVHAKKGGE